MNFENGNQYIFLSVLIFQVQFTALLFREKTKKLEQQIAAADTEIKKPIPYRGERKKSFLSLVGYVFLISVSAAGVCCSNFLDFSRKRRAVKISENFVALSECINFMINISFFLIFQVQFTALLFREKTKKLEQQIAAADTEIKKTYTLPRREKKGFPLL